MILAGTLKVRSSLNEVSFLRFRCNTARVGTLKDRGRIDTANSLNVRRSRTPAATLRVHSRIGELDSAAACFLAACQYAGRFYGEFSVAF
jgi:hypothetical protein